MMAKLNKTVSDNKGIVFAMGATITTILTVITYLNSSYVSSDTYEGHVKGYDQYVLVSSKNQQAYGIALERATNKLRQEMKQSRIDQLVWDKKILLAKGSNLTDYDKVIITLIDTELETLRGR